jgi:glycosyltransferase involved in cell wall biosynthesis
MRVLFLNQYFHPDVAATAQLASDLGEHLAAAGHEVWALASARAYAAPQTWRPLYERHRGVSIVRVPATALGRRSRAARVLDYGSYLAALVPTVLALPRPDLVVALSTPPLVAALGLLLRRRGARLAYWVMDVYPEVAIALGALGERSLAARALQGLSRRIISEADLVIALDDAMAGQLTAAGADPRRLQVIDNWVDDTIRPHPGGDHALRQRLGLGDRFTISYSGNMGMGHDFDTVLQAMERLARHPQRDALHWLFVGDGPRRAALEARVRALGVPHTFLSYRARAELPLSLTAADASLVTLDERLAGLLAPSKVYGLLAAGVPILYVGPEAGRTSELVATHGVGLAVKNGDAAGLAQAVLALAHDPARARAMGARGRALHEARFRKDEALARHRTLLEEVARC